jgi:hypothetical protein
MSKQWHYIQDGAQYGPVDEAEIAEMIRCGELPIGTPVLEKGSKDWEPARKHTCFQVEIFLKKKRPPVQVAASSASKPASSGTSQSPRQTTSPVEDPLPEYEPDEVEAEEPFEIEEEPEPVAVVGGYKDSIVWFFLCFSLFMACLIVIPKFKTIFTDMLGEGEGLPEFTLLVLAISDAIKNNALITLPLGLLLCLGFAYFMGFKIRFLKKNLCKIIDGLFILLFGGLLLGVIIAMFLPLIKMMDKLG